MDRDCNKPTKQERHEQVTHAGALLGDVLHDPFQCFFAGQELIKTRNGKFIPVAIDKEINSLMKKLQDRTGKIEKDNYEAIFLPNNELIVMGETNGTISPVEVLSSNRHEYEGEMIKLTMSDNKQLSVTPEHLIAIWKNGKITYIQARNIKKGDEVVWSKGWAAATIYYFLAKQGKIPESDLDRFAKAENGKEEYE